MDDGIARMGEVVFSGPNLPELRALGLGSCIGLCAFDPSTKLACLAHIVLPQARTKDTDEAGKYADTAIPYVVKQMTARGANASRLRFAIAGGAQLFSFPGSDSQLDVGRRNIEAVKELLADMNLKLVGEDTGGKSGRTVTFDSQTGEVLVRQAGGSVAVIAVLS
ncbi:MAG: chemotaxis protein CheD [Armatimonadetes bacterium]|nr:chemotaxis protein CheD [Armatimonadota bacterium]